MHLKTLVIRGAAPTVIAGQANVTPNSFSGAWCETDVEIHDRSVADTVAAHFDALWQLPESRALTPAGALAAPARFGARILLGALASVGLKP